MTTSASRAFESCPEPNRPDRTGTPPTRWCSRAKNASCRGPVHAVWSRGGHHGALRDAGTYKLAQSLGCLLDNAIKFTSHGAVQLRVSRVGNGSDNLPLCIEVVDSGVGFATPPDVRLYQRFQQLDGSMTREYGGLGIGLALVELHLGRRQPA